MKVIFLHGSIGVGKYSIGRKLCEISSLPLFHNHLVVDMATSLFEFGTSGFKILREKSWLNTFEIAAKENKSFIFTFAPEATVEPSLITKLISVVEKNGGKILFVEIHAQTETILKRIGNEDRKEFGKLTNVDFYIKLKNDGKLDFPSMPNCFMKINTDVLSVEQAANEIYSKIKDLL